MARVLEDLEAEGVMFDGTDPLQFYIGLLAFVKALKQEKNDISDAWAEESAGPDW